VRRAGERVRAARRAERYLGATEMPNFVRRAAGPGWALVGDAGCHKDPFLALGICDALRDAELLADAVGRGAPGEYPAERDAETRPGYEQNLVAARLEPPAPDHARLRSALRGNPAETTQFFLALEGMVDPRPFFEESHLRELITHA
jgi:flavin-dependent dehydrogenase